MFADQTTIGKLVARCPLQTEHMRARLRISHLLQSADFTPPGFPPQAILVVRRAVSQAISLSSYRLNSDWQRELRENISRLYRRAVRPVRGIVPEGAEAVLFADEGEWLACAGIAVQARQVEQAWYWRACLRNEAVSSSRTLVHLWAATPRFVPAAVAHLADWGCVASVLKLFSPSESNAVFAALAEEWNLPQRELPRREPIKVEAAARSLPTLERATDGSVNTPVSHRPFDQEAVESFSPPLRIDHYHDTKGAKAPWKTWLPALEKPCEALPIETQLLLAGAVALFHAPAVARSASFAEEVSQWLLAIVQRHEPVAAQALKTEKVITSDRESREAVRTTEGALPSRSLAPGSVGKARALLVNANDFKPDVPGAKQNVTGVSPQIGKVKSEAARPTGKVEKKSRRFWQDLSGCETKIGGVLFLINLLQQTRLPECFDDEWDLSQHVSGWGLVELIGKALLGPSCADFHNDPMWTTLQLLDGRTTGEVAGASLPEVFEYRMPVEWLKRFVAPDEPWSVSSSPGRLRLWHRSGAFTVVDCTLDALNVSGRAASELELYRAQGITAGLEQDEFLDEELTTPFLVRMQAIPEWSNLSRSMRRWMCWTFPFLQYVLGRALGEEAATPESLGPLLLQKTGTLYCTATHVDLVMRMDQIVMPVRRAGLDANPGWLPDLMRVVSFHFE